MAKGLPKNYTFSVAAKTITLTDITTVRLDKLALITNTTTNKILYNFADSTVATATVATNVITLSVLQGGEANSDKLRIDYDIESSDTSAFADTIQPVSGTVTANAGTGTLAVSLAANTPIIAAGSALIGKVSIDQVTANANEVVTKTGSVTNATLQTGSNTIGALTANQSVNVNQLAGNTISSGVGATGTGTTRIVQANDAGKTILSKAGTASSSGDNTIINAGTNKLKIKAFSLTTTSTTAVTCIFKSSTTVLWQVILQAPTGVSVGANLVVPAPDFIFSTASATLLNLNLSSAQTIHYSVSYYDEA